MAFEFTIYIRVDGSRQVARRIAEAMAEYLEDATCGYGRTTPLLRAIERARGVTLEVSGVTQTRQDGEGPA